MEEWRSGEVEEWRGRWEHCCRWRGESGDYVKDSKNCLPEVTGLVVPLDAIVVLVVEDGQAGLVMELLEPLNGDP